MNLHGIVAGYVGSINPNVPVTLQVSIGSVTANDGSRSPSYGTPIAGLVAQVQELTTRDLRQLERLNIQGSTRKIYLNGEVDAIIRVSQKGGDLITMADGSIYLTTMVLEQWPDWCAVSVTLQNGS